MQDSTAANIDIAIQIRVNGSQFDESSRLKRIELNYDRLPNESWPSSPILSCQILMQSFERKHAREIHVSKAKHRPLYA